MEKLFKVLKECGIENADGKLSQYEKYMAGLLDWNKKVNLTSITNEAEFEQKHYIDSLACINSSEFRNARSIIDVGSGGGFPGIPLAIAFPEKEFLLLDSSAKRMNIVAELAEEVGIKNVEAVHMRAEDAGHNPDYRESFDVCLSRAVAPLSVLLEYCIPFVKLGGFFIAYKGPEANSELLSAETAMEALGARFIKEENLEGTSFGDSGMEQHRLLYFLKEQKTPDKYPRSAGKPTKRPL